MNRVKVLTDHLEYAIKMKWITKNEFYNLEALGQSMDSALSKAEEEGKIEDEQDLLIKLAFKYPNLINKLSGKGE